MSTLTSTIESTCINPSFLDFQKTARQFGYDSTKKFRPFERQELIEKVTQEIFTKIDNHLINSPGTTLSSEQKNEFRELIRNKIIQVCEVNENSYQGYSTTSTFWPWLTSFVSFKQQGS